MPPAPPDSSEPLSMLPLTDGHKPARAKALIALGALVLLVSQVGLFLQVAPFPTWFYVFAWWSWILFADGVVHLRTGSSLLLSRTRGFLLLLPWSLTFWLLFEAANFVLQDWYYVFVPADPLERSIGISVSFATVIPGMLETVDLLAAFGFAKSSASKPLTLGSRANGFLFVAGLSFLVLPLAFPEFAYPLIWGAPVLLIEPLLLRAGQRGYLTQFARGELSTLLRFLVAGLCCGLLWEFWNFWATAKWIYTVPFFEEGKLFEMPVLGFLGYPPFALSIYSFVRALVALRLCPEVERTELPSACTPGATLRQLIGVAIALALAAWILPGVERETVHSTKPTVAELLRDAELTERATASGLSELRMALSALRTGELRTDAGPSPEQIERIYQRAELLQLAGLGDRGVRWLESIGVTSVVELAALSEDELLERIRDDGTGPMPEPYARELRVWHRHAQSVRD